MGCGKGKMQGDDSEKQQSLKWAAHTKRVSLSHLIANSNFLEKDDLKYVNPC